MKTSELTGANLDAWVARADPMCEGCIVHFVGEHMHGPHYVGMHEGSVAIFIPAQTNFRQSLLLKREYKFAQLYRPTVDWSQGGPIIERERIQLIPWKPELAHIAGWSGRTLDDWQGSGETALIAAMRAYVASKFGETVPDEVPA